METGRVDRMSLEELLTRMGPFMKERANALRHKTLCRAPLPAAVTCHYAGGYVPAK